MLLNIMYYQLSGSARASRQIKGNSLSIGPLYVSSEQVEILRMFSLCFIDLRLVSV